MPEIEEGDYTSDDGGRTWYQFGKLVFTHNEENGDEKALAKRLLKHADQRQFFPNAWLISDHGNAELFDYWPKKG